MQKLIRITTVPLSLEKLLEGQLTFMQDHYEVIAVSADKERLSQFGRDNGVATKHIELTRQITPVKDLKALYHLYRYLKQEKPLIVHSHTPKAGIIGMLAAKLAGVPHRLHTVAGLPLMEATGIKRKVLNAVEKMTYRASTKVYPNSQGLYSFILAEKFSNKKKLKVLGNGSSNGIDTTYFDPSSYDFNFKNEMRQKIGIPANDFIFIFVGRLVSDKGINELVKAFSQLQERHNDISLLLVGPLEEALDPLATETINEIKNNKKVFSVGYQQDVRPYFAISQVLAFPSYREGFPNVVMQAGAMGLPAIVTNINGCNEIIIPSINGAIIPVKDVSALKGAMFNMLKNKTNFAAMMDKARNQIASQYDRKKMWEIILAEYKKISTND